MKHKIWQNLYIFKKQLFKIDYENIWHIGATINTINKKFQKVSFENPLYGNMFFWQKDPKRDNNPKRKINTLVH
jgi:hypothetical protein